MVYFYLSSCESSSVVELHLAKVAVASSSLVSRSNLRAPYRVAPFFKGGIAKW
jgi:hypothetical protein